MAKKNPNKPNPKQKRSPKRNMKVYPSVDTNRNAREEKRKRRKDANKKRGKSTRETSSSFSRMAWMIAAACVVVTLVVYLGSLNNGFTNWDDDMYVTSNPYINSLSGENLQKIFGEPLIANYHPLTLLSLAVDYSVGELDPFVYHLTSLLIHLIATFLVFLFAYRLSDQKWELACIVALLFGIHPMHVESVAWVSERKDVLYGAFFVGGLITYLDYIKTQKTSSYIFTMVLFMLSCLSKPAAVVFPLILLALDYFHEQKMDLQVLIEKVVKKAPFFLLAFVFGVLTIRAQAQSDALDDVASYSMIERVMFASYGLVMYIGKFLVPVQLSSFYPYPEGSLPILYKIAPLLVLVLGGAVWYSLRYTKVVAFGMGFFLIGVALVLQFVSVGEAIMADRYTYIPYIGLSIIVAWGYGYVMENRASLGDSTYYGTTALLAAYVLFLGFQSYQQIKVWKDSETLWTNVIKYSPEMSGAYNNRGNFYKENNRLEEAMADFNKAIEADPENHLSFSNRGTLFRKQNKFDLALADFNKALELKPTYHLAYTNRGNVYFSLNRDEEAIADYNQALKLKNTDFNAYSNRAAIYARTGRYDLAEQDFNMALKYAPRAPNVYLNRALMYDQMQRFDKSIADYSVYLKMNPNHAGVYKNRAIAYQRSNQHNLAIKDIDTALKVQPNQGEFFWVRSYSYKALGNTNQAAQDVRQARKFGLAVDQLDPAHVAAVGG